MLLDELVQVIETLKGHIAIHRDSLQENETRTRMALIDPLLTALGWNTADPSLVTPEYKVIGRWADYALLSQANEPAATVEAKKLNEPLAPHRMQMLNYANAEGIKYAGLTDGNLWELYDVFKPDNLEKSRILDVSVANEPAHQSALKLLLLWRPNLASGRPTPASQPILPIGPSDAPTITEPVPVPGSPAGNGWTPLTNFLYETGKEKPLLHLPDGTEKQTRHWYQVTSETAEWLIRAGQLNVGKCPVTGNGKTYIVDTQPHHQSGETFRGHLQLSNGLFLNKHGIGKKYLENTKSLLTSCGQDPALVMLKMNRTHS